MELSKNKIIGLVFIICVAIAGFMMFSSSENKTAAPDNSIRSKPVANTNGLLDDSSVFLYFCDRNRPFLVAEERVLSHPKNPVMFGHSIIEALIQGPQNGMMRTISVDTVLRALYIKDKTGFADFSREIADSHPGGAQLEYLTVFSIVNTLVLNIPEIDSIKILVEGQDKETLAGHIDIRNPLKANMLLVR